MTYRFLASTPNTQLVIESMGEIELPDRGMLGRHAQFDPMVMRTPRLAATEKTSGKNSDGEWEMHIQREGAWTKVFYPLTRLTPQAGKATFRLGQFT